jgi:integrase
MASILQVGAKWRALIRRKGHKSICKTFATKAAAEKWARGIESKLDDGLPVAEERTTVADMIETYRKLRDQSRPVRDDSTEHYILRSLTAGLGTLQVARLTPQDLAGYCTRRRDEGAGPYTCNMDVSKLGTVLRYAGMARAVPVPDVAGAARPLLAHLGLIGGGGRRERRPTVDELQRVLVWLAENKGPLYSDIVTFAVASAMRQGEISALAWADVDRTKRLVRSMRKHPRKGKTLELVPMLPESWAVIERQPQVDGEPMVFPIGPKTVSKYFTEACRALSIPDLHFHDLRHEGTSRLFEQGLDIQHVALVTGHKSWAHLRRYTNLRPEDVHAKLAPPTPPTPPASPARGTRRGRPPRP